MKILHSSQLAVRWWNITNRTTHHYDFSSKYALFRTPTASSIHSNKIFPISRGSTYEGSFYVTFMHEWQKQLSHPPLVYQKLPAKPEKATLIYIQRKNMGHESKTPSSILNLLPTRSHKVGVVFFFFTFTGRRFRFQLHSIAIHKLIVNPLNI